jgi:sulfide:quinone oxidoreductase
MAGMPTNVLIVGGGPAALEAALRLHRLAGDRVTTTVLAPETDFTYRPLRVLEPFAAGSAWSYPLARIAADAGFTHVRGKLARVDAAEHAVETTEGQRVDYDVLLLATGAVPARPYAGATVFTGTPADAETLHGLVQDVEGGYTRSIAFVAPPGLTWPLPLYELALMTAAHVAERAVPDVRLSLVTPESTPLELFGPAASDAVRELLDERGIDLHLSRYPSTFEHRRLALVPGEPLFAERVVSLPGLVGPELAGLASDSGGFIPVDAHGLVIGEQDVYAAGDATNGAIKQGGIAAQQADAAAAAIAARAGAPVAPEPFRPVLRGLLLTGATPRFMRAEVSGGRGADWRVSDHALWWPPSKIAGKRLAPYLALRHAELDEDPAGFPVDIEIPERRGAEPAV